MIQCQKVKCQSRRVTYITKNMM